MRKISKTALSVLLCVTMVLTSGCSIGSKSKKETEKKASEYVTLGEYKQISMKKSDVDEQVQKQIDSTLDSYAEYKKKKSGSVLWVSPLTVSTASICYKLLWAHSPKYGTIRLSM